ncbi:thiamine biosynthesis protein ThiS [Alkaliphilus metalliredigens QYMF]|uniref:Thiamine biosynthesis protein ThiS n=1 Tax=Alkaliphilus metalliredigens (strain QYMF) TaxID=293826 RepID=A6TTW2_ALKMQ|nr:sulfur carrier protein ThiS [Alkaliphilus metalliredigens]ABR49630.1 thiamine biosynthesis protein ThiS [Alkaliphilus metalliredigens QYMF]
MKIKINGEEKELQKEVNILELLVIQEVQMPEMVSVELNGEIVDRDDFENTLLKENDVIELLYFMGGGTFGL